MIENSGRPHLDMLLEVLSDYRRRHLLVHMHASDKDVFALENLAKTLLTRNQKPGRTDENHVQKVKTALHHSHLPKMDETGLIEYDPRTGDVRYRGSADIDIGDLLELLNLSDESTNTLDQ